MVNLTNKERFLLEGEKYQQQLAIDKYNNFALQAADPILKTIFSNLSEIEENHLNMVNEMLQGRIPQINTQTLHPYYTNTSSLSNEYLNIGNMTITSMDNSFDDGDNIICFDALTTEELLHSTYSASSLEFEESEYKSILSKIIDDKKNSLQYLNDYMTKKGMYNNTIYF